MIALLQRVTHGRVEVDGTVVGEIGPGLLVLLAVEPSDTEAQADRLVERLLGYRVFDDSAGRMNLSLADTGGGLLLVPQFTLAADTRKGCARASPARPPLNTAERSSTTWSQRARAQLGDRVATGRFGAHMQVSLTNDGPVTFWLRTAAPHAGA